MGAGIPFMYVDVHILKEDLIYEVYAVTFVVAWRYWEAGDLVFLLHTLKSLLRWPPRT